MSAPAQPLIIFDVNETLVSIKPLADVLQRGGAPSHLLPTWFASVLRDGFAHAAMGGCAQFRPLAEAVLRSQLQGVVENPDELAKEVLDAFPTLPLHDDVAEGLKLLNEAGCRMVTFTNGTATVAKQLFEGTAADDLIEEHLDVQMAGAWKPSPAAYKWVCEHCQVSPSQAVLVAVHPWDVAGAQSVGLNGVWLDRPRVGWPHGAFDQAPQVTIHSLADADCASRLAAASSAE